MVLRLPLNFVGTEGFAHLVPYLTHHDCRLQELDLTDNDLGDEGCAIVSEVLKFNRSLSVMNLAGNFTPKLARFNVLIRSSNR